MTFAHWSLAQWFGITLGGAIWLAVIVSWFTDPRKDNGKPDLPGGM
jgi:hypothetical protein